MEEQDSKQLTVTIAGRPYPLKIKANDEPVIRQIVKEVNEKINKFQLTYANREKQDCLAMAILAYAVDLHKATSQTTASSPEISDKLARIESLLDEAMP
ncbi:MAG: cell division protein ZapA [Saprospiraceae bacterium]|nr:cell division protein ZapA [Saprospiraceae bacterium]MCF8250295.1 cell division protein ZapA [Saprospiraceae bacterium]MCF8280980.1 cell division protein ZapA [Bacteroidales bacterium]MCF8312073.1 cell division protein ZapA [Saprospiraceae bacterium]MCF8440480.1 cell division protein ZapA [Saprospiraceae bacterium]